MPLTQLSVDDGSYKSDGLVLYAWDGARAGEGVHRPDAQRSTARNSSWMSVSRTSPTAEVLDVDDFAH